MGVDRNPGRWSGEPSRAVFRCRGCGAPVTVPVREVPLPAGESAPVPWAMTDPEQQTPEGCPPRMAPGCYAWETPEETGARRPVRDVLLAPGDVRGLRLTADRRRRNGCCGLDGCDGPNLLCAGCGAEIATRRSDCWTPQQVTLHATAVTRTRVLDGGPG